MDSIVNVSCVERKRRRRRLAITFFYIVNSLSLFGIFFFTFCCILVLLFSKSCSSVVRVPLWGRQGLKCGNPSICVFYGRCAGREIEELWKTEFYVHRIKLTFCRSWAWSVVHSNQGTSSVVDFVNWLGSV